MNLANGISLIAMLISMAALVGGAFWRLLTIANRGDNLLYAKLGALQGKFELDIGALRDDIGREFLRTREFEISQRNTDRRLESIESKVDKIPESLDRQSERLIAALKN